MIPHMTGLLVFIEMKQKKNCWKKKKIKMANSKKPHFPARPILNVFSWKFHGLVFGLVELSYTKGTGVAQLICLWGCPTWAQKQANCVFRLFLSLFRTASWPYRLSHTNVLHINHSYYIGQGPFHEIFTKKYWELAELENEVFWVGHFEFFASSQWKQKAHSYEVSLISAIWMVS